jgi:hypothetical protein
MSIVARLLLRLGGMPKNDGALLSSVVVGTFAGTDTGLHAHRKRKGDRSRQSRVMLIYVRVRVLDNKLATALSLKNVILSDGIPELKAAW